MTTARRVQQQPAFILHRRPFRDSSQLLDIVTRDFGKIALVARGSRSSKSRLAGILRPFLPLNVSWVARGDLGTMTGAEAAGAPKGIHGDAMLSAFYVNELLINFLHRHDPQPEIYALYADVISALASTADIAACLRSFEIELLGLLGYAVSFRDHSAPENQLDPEQHYSYRHDQGPVAVARSDGPMVFSGAMLRSIEAQEFDRVDVLRAANRLLREIINHHLGGKVLNSRKVLLDLHRGRIAQRDDLESKND